MAITVPSPEQVQELFRETMTQLLRSSGELRHEEYYGARRRGIDSCEERLDPVIKIETVGQNILFRMADKVIIENHEDGQLQRFAQHFRESAEHLIASLPQSCSLRLMFEFPLPNNMGYCVHVPCMVQGVGVCS
jgi:hypothetical protein